MSDRATLYQAFADVLERQVSQRLGPEMWTEIDGILWEVAGKLCPERSDDAGKEGV